MDTPVSRFRLRSTAFNRPDDDAKILPKRVVFLSVEGDVTEVDYFKHLNEFLDNSIIQIEVLRHKKGDGYSDPRHAIELLEEYIQLRQGNAIPPHMIQTLVEKYSPEIIQGYICDNNSIDSRTRNSIKEELLLIGIDYDYRKYLQSYNNDEDVFAVIIDRDCASHSRELMQNCINHCATNNYGCYITNPCFEFWLLLHLCDVKQEFSDEDLEEFRCNPVVSNQHTRVSEEVSKRAGHAKKISISKFERYYLPNIKEACARAEEFTSTLPEVLDEIGTNMALLLETLIVNDKK